MRYVIPIVLLLAALAGIWWFGTPRPPAPSEPGGGFIMAPAERPEPRYPLPQRQPDPEPAAPLDPAELSLLAPDPVDAESAPGVSEPVSWPSLIDSDPRAVTVLEALIGAPAVQRWLRPEWIISRLVVMVHSLDGPAPPVEARPLALLRGVPQALDSGDGTLYWTAASASRHAELIALLGSVAPDLAYAAYRDGYPLFQQAWEELGEPEPWFNDRLIDIIDHLLAGPLVELPIEVVAWEGRFKFADATLEAQSWGRKLMLRQGPEQSLLVRDWLRAFRQAAAGPGEDSFN